MAEAVGLLGQVLWRARALVRPPVTLGVRLAVFDTLGRTVLVRHTYVAGWHFPGGAVDAGEAAVDAALREFREETGLAVSGAPTLFGLYFNRSYAARDHVALFVVTGHPPFDVGEMKPQAAEIAEAVAIPATDPPAGVTGATRRRLGEVLGGGAPDVVW